MVRPQFIFVDTNVAIQEAHLFRRKGGPQLIELLRETGVRIVVPEVLRKEYIKHFGKESHTVRDLAEKELTKLESLCGQKLTWLLPEANFEQQEALTILHHLDDIIISVPQTEELLLAAAHRSMENRAPSSKSDHGYKDCLIWESILSVAGGGDVRILTRDKAFYDGEKSNKLAPSIVAEAEALGIVLKAYSGKDESGKDSVIRPIGALIEDLCAEHKHVDLARLKPFELSEHPLRISPIAAVPIATYQAMASDNEDASLPAEENELSTLLTNSREQFWALETKVLGVVAFLNGGNKEELYALLEKVGIDLITAKNVCDRLALAGLIQDTGNNYLPVQGRVAEIAAELVEGEVIRLMRMGK